MWDQNLTYHPTQRMTITEIPQNTVPKQNQKKKTTTKKKKKNQTKKNK